MFPQLIKCFSTRIVTINRNCVVSKIGKKSRTSMLIENPTLITSRENSKPHSYQRATTIRERRVVSLLSQLTGQIRKRSHKVLQLVYQHPKRKWIEKQGPQKINRRKSLFLEISYIFAPSFNVEYSRQSWTNSVNKILHFHL